MLPLHACRRTYRRADATCFLKAPAGWQRWLAQHGLTSGMVTAATVLGFSASQAFAGPAQAADRLANAPLQGTNKTWAAPPPGYTQGQCMVLPASNAKGDEIRALMNVTQEACCERCAALRCPCQPPCTAPWLASNAPPALSCCRPSLRHGAQLHSLGVLRRAGRVWQHLLLPMLPNCLPACALLHPHRLLRNRPTPARCNNGYGQRAPPGSCGLRSQAIPNSAVSEYSLAFWDRGTATVNTGMQAPVNYTVPFTRWARGDRGVADGRKAQSTVRPPRLLPTHDGVGVQLLPRPALASGYVLRDGSGSSTSSAGMIAGAVAGGMAALALVAGAAGGAAACNLARC